MVVLQKPPGASSMNPEMLEQRLKEIEGRISCHADEVNAMKGFSAAETTSRHKLELETALNQGYHLSILDHCL